MLTPSNTIEQIGIISIDRSRNCAYIWHSREKPENERWATNMECKLDWLENLLGCTFKDGKLDHWIMVNFHSDFEELPRIEWLPWPEFKIESINE